MVLHSNAARHDAEACMRQCGAGNKYCDGYKKNNALTLERLKYLDQKGITGRNVETKDLIFTVGLNILQ